ncbi:hypothetical protein AGMMS49546_35460 [Spirochaetia bacterium]|nr:hypothetical protein AGMMS49546_35460 [Spirochaetia bacterium]
MNFNEKDPVYILEAILDMILKITAEVYDSIEYYHLDFDEEMLAKDKAEFLDNLNLCAVYIDMGIINFATGFLIAYGAAASETPKLQLKGSGDIILKAGKQKEIYVEKNLSGGSPVGAIHETIDTAVFLTKLGVKASSLVREGIKLGKASSNLALTDDEVNKKKVDKKQREREDLL